MDSVLAIDINTGPVNWVRQVPSFDTKRNSPAVATPGADFGMAPTFIPADSGASTPCGRDIIVVGQKNGSLFAPGC